MKPPISKPGTSLKVKTGEWRTSLKPVVDSKKCLKCGICMGYCPEGILGKPGETPDIDYDYCKGCGICAAECPAKAIHMEREEK
jgi:2-oxoacid:acceptor oxidoreductase delta subunit (pyruvate/2-ketoisovalerate family)